MSKATQCVIVTALIVFSVVVRSSRVFKSEAKALRVCVRAILFMGVYDRALTDAELTLIRLEKAVYRFLSSSN